MGYSPKGGKESDITEQLSIPPKNLKIERYIDEFHCTKQNNCTPNCTEVEKEAHSFVFCGLLELAYTGLQVSSVNFSEI